MILPISYLFPRTLVKNAMWLDEFTRPSKQALRFIGERLAVVSDSRGTAARRWRPNWWKRWQVELGYRWFNGRRARECVFLLSVVLGKLGALYSYS